MAAHKSAPAAETPDEVVSAPEPTPEPPPEPAPASAPAAPEPAPEPIHTYKAPRPAPIRAGGHVLTERGWEIDTGQLDTEQEK